MKQEYKQIILQRKKFLVDHLKCNYELEAALLTNGLITTSAQDELMKYKSPGGRAFRLLDFLTTSEDPDVFSKFCQILQDCGLYDASVTLLKDRNNIEWDFRTRTGSATSPDNYLDMINELLIRLLLVEPDKYVIKVLTKETHNRLSALSLYLKTEKLRKSNFRKAIAKMAGDHAVSLLQRTPPCIDWASYEFEELIDSEQRLDDALLAEMRTLYEKSEMTKSTLEARCEFYNEAIDQYHNKDAKWRYKDTSHDKQIDRLVGMIVNQDNKILKLHEENAKVKGQLSLSTSQHAHINETIGALYKIRPRREEDTSNSIDVSNGAKLVAALDKHLADVGWRTDQFKQRLREMADRITELEREKTAGVVGGKVNRTPPGSINSDGVRVNMEKVAHERLLVLNRAQARKITNLARDNAHFQKQVEELREYVKICKPSSVSLESKQQALVQRWQLLPMPPRTFTRSPGDGRKQRQASFGRY